MEPDLTAWAIIRPNFSLGWNLFLALVPLGLSFLLFTKNPGRNLGWWFGVGLFIVFLPNAAYTLTDIIHFLAKIRVDPPLPSWAILLLIVEFGLYFLITFQSYVWSLLNVDGYLQHHGLKQWIIPIELALNLLSSIGIYLGRFQRLNSWNIVTAPEKVFHQSVEDFTARQPVKMMILIYVVITLLYYVVKGINRLVVKQKRSQA
jgi:uncharacterized membrane protein